MSENESSVLLLYANFMMKGHIDPCHSKETNFSVVGVDTSLQTLILMITNDSQKACTPFKITRPIALILPAIFH